MESPRIPRRAFLGIAAAPAFLTTYHKLAAAERKRLKIRDVQTMTIQGPSRTYLLVRVTARDQLGEGDDGIREWMPPFGELFRRLEAILLEAEELKLNLPLRRMLTTVDPKVTKELRNFRLLRSFSDGILYGTVARRMHCA